MIDRFLMVLEVLLLVWVVVQGEIIVRCERGVYRLQKEREEERRTWRQAKQKAAVKKIEQKTADSTKGSGSDSTSTTADAESRTTSAKSVEVPSTPTDLPTSITSISK